MFELPQLKKLEAEVKTKMLEENFFRRNKHMTKLKLEDGT
jgi:hypothetical protein